MTQPTYLKSRLGMGCWPIGGPFFRGEQPLGYGNAEDGQSLRTIAAALDHGVRLFDTAAVYGCGHAERLLGQGLRGRDDLQIVTKIGVAFDEQSKQLIGPDSDPDHVRPAIEACLRRLRRDHVDLVLLHQNEVPAILAQPIFDAMDDARQAGLIGAYGWSTDFPQSVDLFAGRKGFTAVQHAMNLYYDAPSMQAQIARSGVQALIRSPLAMGILTGKFGPDSVIAPGDIRATNEPNRDYFRDGRASEYHLHVLDAVRDLLCSGGRSVVQGALGWLLAKSPRNIPIPGARTPEQIIDSAGALDHGPLPQNIMAEIEALIPRPPEGNPRPR